jgi:hypothetical protein
MILKTCEVLVSQCSWKDHSLKNAPQVLMRYEESLFSLVNRSGSGYLSANG